MKSLVFKMLLNRLSKYFAEILTFGSVVLVINRRQHSESNDKVSEGSPESGNFPSTFYMFIFLKIK